MGYASYFEDIRTRLEEAMLELREVPDREAEQHRRKTQALLDACQSALDQLNQLREMVDNPRFDLAYEVTQLDREKKELGAEITELTGKRARLLDHVRRLEAEGKQAKLDLKRLQAEIKRKDDEYEALLRANPEAGYERYWPGPRDAGT